MSISPKSKRILSGMRPTGRLQIGNYFGALQNWVQLQSDPANDCFYFVADWHALTSDYADTSAIAENTLQVTIDFLAAGLDPQKSTIFLQSLIPEHAELHLLLSMVTPLGWLERVPTYKEALENIRNKDLHTYGFLGYPTLQTADIVMYSSPGNPLIVPVGEDQVAHVEMSRELVRRFNLFYGFTINPEIFSWSNRKTVRGALLKLLDISSSEPLLPESQQLTAEQQAVGSAYIRQRVLEMGIGNFFEKLPSSLKSFFSFAVILEEPDALLTKTPRVPGLDGRKMSKSYGNAIMLSESDADIRAKTKVMVTDPARKRRIDPGNPDVCPVYDWHQLFSTPERDPGRLEWVRQGCTTAGIGCIECKEKMADNLIKWIEPIRARRLYYEGKKQRREVKDILREGSVKARLVAQDTMIRARDSVMGKDRIRRRTILKKRPY